MTIRILLVSVLLGVSGVSQAALFDRGGGMIYDDVLNITWLLDANAGAGSIYDDGSSTTDGRMTWESAVAWADNLVYGGFDDWRLPSANPTGDATFSFNGSTDIGYNNTVGELGHMFYNNLGNIGLFDINGAMQTGHGLLNTSFTDATPGGGTVSFLNVACCFNWYREEFSATLAWAFNTDFGFQSNDFTKNDAGGYSWAVRVGDVGSFDADGDGFDLTSDNCTFVSNSDQRDTNADGFGNACDFDFNNDCTTNFLDLSQFATAFGSSTGDPNFNDDVDLDANGVINFLDFGAPPNNFGSFFTNPPGPSAVVCSVVS